MPQSTQCIEPTVLAQFLDETLDESQEDLVQEHIDSCEQCQKALELVAGDPTTWSRVREHLSGTPIVASPEADNPGKAPDEMEELKALLDHSDDPTKIGRIGVYEICGLVGRGTTGLVLKAMEGRLNRFVAIKLMSPTYRTNGSARRRFEREGRAIAAVSHEHVVPIYAVDEHRGLPYIVMKYIPGLSLEQRIERDGPLDNFEVTRIGLQVAQGLAAAHAQGIVHRDVKPANVILEDTVERTMVTDFGLARVADEASMTCSGTISGTPQYMSPEQARGDTIDLRSDLFSLGSLLYAACAGRPPFRAENIFGVIHRVCKTEPRNILEINPEIDEWLAALIGKLMAKEPEARFQTASQVAAVLSVELAFLQNPSTGNRPTREWMPQTKKATSTPGLGRKLASRVALVAGLLAIATFGYKSLDQPKSERTDPQSAQAALFPGFPSFANAEPPSVGIGPIGLQEDGWNRRERTIDGQSKVTFEQTIVRTFPVVGQTSMNIDVLRGDVEIVAGEDGQVRCTLQRSVLAADQEQAQQRAGIHRFQFTQQEDSFHLEGDTGRMQEPGPDTEIETEMGIAYRMEIPIGMQAEVLTAEGRILVGDLAENIKVTAGGDIYLGNIAGKIRARANGGSITMSSGNGEKAELLAIGGDIYIQNSTGGARARTSNGDVYLGASTGEVYAQVSGGDIYIKEIAGKTGGHSSIGNVYFMLNNTPTADSRFSCAGGGIFVRMGMEVAGTIQARGLLQSQIPFEMQYPDDGREPYHESKVNGGGPMIQLSSPQGVLSIARLGDLRTTVGPSTLSRNSAGHSADDSQAKGASKGAGKNPVGLGGSSNGKGLGGSGSSKDSLGSGPRGGSGSADSKTNPSGSSLGGSGGSGGSGGLGGSGGSGGLGGSSGSGGLSGSGSGSSGLGGSGSGGVRTQPRLTEAMIAKTSGAPRAGALVTVPLSNPTGNIDGYTFYLPQSYDSFEGTYPILVYLQGAYGVGGTISDLNNWGLARLLRDETDMSIERNQLLLDRFIVVCPHIQDAQYHSDPEVMESILDEILASYKADPDRIYVTGLSRGGHGSWGLPCRIPGKFAAIAPVGGHANAVDDYKKLNDVAIWIAHNKSDGTVPYSHSENAAIAVEEATGMQFLRATPFDVASTEYLTNRLVFTSSLSGGHDAWTDLYTSAEFYKWLLAQKRVPQANGNSEGR